ncbi:hypothetical protein IAQ61_004562 [Plenodomus lingam]|uniref:uncharacterized protein n=1 Tax=Leptosphaeria maculans TaxID=5022 RepID=UPI00331AC989|nr:hypothetical protein IAQ61_004562 [Plenodomus lingam]
MNSNETSSRRRKLPNPKPTHYRRFLPHSYMDTSTSTQTPPPPIPLPPNLRSLYIPPSPHKTSTHYPGHDIAQNPAPKQVPSHIERQSTDRSDGE